VRVDRHTLTAQLPLEGLGVSRADPSLLAESVASTASQPRRSHRKP
jgi:hypothetical protein